MFYQQHYMVVTREFAVRHTVVLAGTGSRGEQTRIVDLAIEWFILTGPASWIMSCLSLPTAQRAETTLVSGTFLRQI
jgi:hypothetical protein